MVHDPVALRAVLAEAALPDLPLAFRPMFGGIMAYVEGKPFASLSDIGLALKFAGEAHAAALGVAGAARLRYAPDQPESKSYVVMPETVLRDSTVLREWIARSAAGVAAAAKNTQTNKNQANKNQTNKTASKQGRART
jgi:TfoX/Sxy family transcriptional regulator of competence genes